MKRDEIREIIKETVEELRRQGLLKIRNEGEAYSDVSALLRKYYEEGKGEKRLIKTLDELKGDKYFDIIPLYFSYGYTIEKIAECYEVEITTIVRNKKRLCLEIWRRIQ